MANDDRSSVAAGIQFISYKMDRIDFSVTQELGVLSQKDHSDCEPSFEFSFRDAFKFPGDETDSYVTGLQVKIVIKNKNNDKEIAKGVFVITGLFTSLGQLTKDIEEEIVKYQCPTILFPYIRASISFTLASAGFSTIVLPIVNVNAAAREANIKIIDRS